MIHEEMLTGRETQPPPALQVKGLVDMINSKYNLTLVTVVDASDVPRALSSRKRPSIESKVRRTRAQPTACKREICPRKCASTTPPNAAPSP